MTSAEVGISQSSNGKPLTTGEQRVLDYIRLHEGKTKQFIAERLKLETTSVGVYLSKLGKRGLLLRQKDGEDARVVRYFPVREPHALGSEVEKTATGAQKLGALFQSTEFDTLKTALGAATSLLDKEVQKPENYDLVLVYHLGGVIQHLSKILRRTT